MHGFQTADSPKGTEKLISSLVAEESIRIPFSEEKITGLELRHQVEMPKVLDCRFCAYPKYRRVFTFFDGSGVVTYADAILTSHYEGDGQFSNHITILTNIPYTIRIPNKQSMDYQLEVVGFEIQYIDGRRTKRYNKRCQVSNMGYEVAYTVSIHCNVDFIMSRLKDECFTVQIFKKEENDLEQIPVLTSPLLVRHCEREETDYTKDIALVGFVYQKNLLFLIDWIEHHIMIGISHFFMFVHIGVSSTTYDSTEIFNVLDTYVEDGVMTMFIWDHQNDRSDQWSPKAGEQRAAANDAMNRFGHKFQWMAFLDDDEYIIPIGSNRISNTLRKYYVTDNFNMHLRSHVFKNYRVLGKDSEVISEVYPEFDEVINTFRKTIVKPEECEHFDIHNCALRKNGEPKPLYKYIMRFFDGRLKHPIEGWNFFDSESEAFLAHFYYKKYHFRNPLRNEELKENSRESNLVTRFSVELKKRVRQRKAILKSVFGNSLTFLRNHEDIYLFSEGGAINDPRNFTEFRLPHFSKHWCEEEYGGSIDHKNCVYIHKQKFLKEKN